MRSCASNTNLTVQHKTRLGWSRILSRSLSRVGYRKHTHTTDYRATVYCSQGLSAAHYLLLLLLNIWLLRSSATRLLRSLSLSLSLHQYHPSTLMQNLKKNKIEKSLNKCLKRSARITQDCTQTKRSIRPGWWWWWEIVVHWVSLSLTHLFYTKHKIHRHKNT